MRILARYYDEPVDTIYYIIRFRTLKEILSFIHETKKKYYRKYPNLYFSIDSKSYHDWITIELTRDKKIIVQLYHSFNIMRILEFMTQENNNLISFSEVID